MRTNDISLVFQGAFKPYVTRERENFIRNIKLTRRALPGAPVILSTWEGSDIPAGLDVDAVVLSKDPGGLAPLKLDDNKVNNINRQLLTTRAGLAAVTTPYAVKIRTDCFLEHAGFLDFHAAQLACDGGRERLLACSFFTLDPRIFEHFSYHLSDWFQFGTTAALQRYWSAPPFGSDHARFYETRPHAAGSTIFETRFRAKFAVEQHLCIHYAQALGYACPAFLNDADPAMLDDFQRFLGREVMILDPWQIGLVFPKYGWVGSSLFQSMNNLMHLDWLALNEPHLAAQPDATALRLLIARRMRQKAIVRKGFHYSRLFHPFLFDPRGRGGAARKAAHRILRYL
jgi:hypothetical protein